MTDDLIELQQAHTTQYTNKGIKSEWHVRENITDRDLHTLPSTLSDRDMFAVLKFARAFELKGLNAGIDWQKNKANALLSQENKLLKEELAKVVEHNEILSHQLTQQLIHQEI